MTCVRVVLLGLTHPNGPCRSITRHNFHEPQKLINNTRIRDISLAPNILLFVLSIPISMFQYFKISLNLGIFNIW